MVDAIRIGFIGAGKVVESRHLPGLENVPGIELRQVWSRSTDNARRLAAAHGIAGVAADWRQVIDAADVDAVIVATPPLLHAEATVAALEAGKHVLCQGRMARNLLEARQMVAAAAERDDRIAALYPPRPGLKGDRVVRRLLHEESFVGQIQEVCVTSMKSLDPPEQYRWMDDPECVGVNAMTLGLWCEVLDRWAGPVERLAAFPGPGDRRRFTQTGDAIPAEVPTSLTLTAELECGARATYHFSTEAPFGAGDSIAIYGTRGALVYEMFADELRGATAGDTGLHTIDIPEDEVRLQSTDAEFAAAIREGTPVSPDFQDGLRYMSFCEAVALSCHTGEIVDVTDMEPTMRSWGRLL